MTRLEVVHNLHHGMVNPRVEGSAHVPLLRVGDQIDDARIRQVLRRIEHVLLPHVVHLSISPFHGMQHIADVAGKALAVRFCLLAK